MLRRGKLTVAAGLTLALVVVGISLRSGGILALAIPFLMYTGAQLAPGLSRRGSDFLVTRRIERDRVEEGVPLHVTLNVENRGRPLLLGLAERIPAGLTVSDGETTALRPLRNGEKVTLDYTLAAPRGEHVLPGTTALAFGPLLIREAESFLPRESRVLVLPHAERLEKIEIRPRKTRVYSGSVRANAGGVGTDFFGCRDYAPGDDVRRINWRVYARRDALVVNEYEQERIADVGVILDARDRVNLRLSQADPFAYSVRAAASLAIHFLEEGNRVGLLIYGDCLNWTYPAYGRVQRERILDALASARTADKVVFEDLRYIPTRLFPSRSQLVVVSPLGDQDDVEVLGTLRARGYQIVLVAPDGFSLERTGESPERDLARRILRLKRALLLSTLAEIGVQVVDWNLTQPFARAAARFLGRRGRRGR